MVRERPVTVDTPSSCTALQLAGQNTAHERSGTSGTRPGAALQSEQLTLYIHPPEASLDDSKSSNATLRGVSGGGPATVACGAEAAPSASSSAQSSSSVRAVVESIVRRWWRHAAAAEAHAESAHDEPRCGSGQLTGVETQDREAEVGGDGWSEIGPPRTSRVLVRSDEDERCCTQHCPRSNAVTVMALWVTAWSRRQSVEPLRVGSRQNTCARL